MTLSKLHVQACAPEEWFPLASRFADFNMNQSRWFVEAAARRGGFSCEYRALHDGKEVLAAAAVRIKWLPLGMGGIAYISAGPLTRRGAQVDAPAFAGALSGLAEEYVFQRGLVLRILAPIAAGADVAVLEDVFQHAGFRATKRTRSYTTMLLDVQRPLPEIRKALQQKWRNCLNRGERIAPEPGEDCGSDAMAGLGDCFQEFKERKGFEPDLDVEFFASIQESAADAERFMVRKLRFEGRTVAATVHSVCGDTSLYVLGMSTPEGLQLKASHVLQWAAIRDAQERGSRWYDLGGIDAAANPGVYDFKAGMNGVEVRAAGPFELVPRGLKAQAVLAAEGTRAFLRSLRSRATLVKK